MRLQEFETIVSVVRNLAPQPPKTATKRPKTTASPLVLEPASGLSFCVGTVYEFPPFRLDTANQCLLKRGPSDKELRIQLPPKAFSILQHLVDNADRLVTHNELMDKVWPDTFVQPEVLASHIRDIRAALGDDARKPRFIETLARRGYRFIAKLGGSNTPAAQPSVDLAGRRLVGRDSFFSKLEQCYRTASAGQRQLVFVTGEPGIGKTALCREFLRRARTADQPPYTSWGQ